MDLLTWSFIRIKFLLKESTFCQWCYLYLPFWWDSFLRSCWSDISLKFRWRLGNGEVESCQQDSLGAWKSFLKWAVIHPLWHVDPCGKGGCRLPSSEVEGFPLAPCEWIYDVFIPPLFSLWIGLFFCSSDYELFFQMDGRGIPILRYPISPQ